MNQRAVAKLAPVIQAVLPELRCRGSVYVVCPIGHALRGLCFESSSHTPENFYVWLFYMPAFVRAEVLSLSWGRRLRGPGGELWNASDSADMSALPAVLRDDARPWLDSLATLQGMTDDLERLRRENPLNTYALQDLAHTYAYRGNFTHAARLLSELPADMDPEVPWQRELAERARTTARAWSEHPETARAQLDAWTRETLKALKLDGVCV
jgi:hypothetical protein